MKILRHIGSLAFVLGLFTAVFAGIPWYMIVADDPVVPWWLRIAVFCLLGGILVVLLTVALEQRKNKTSAGEPLPTEPDRTVLLLNSAALPGREITEILGLVATNRMIAQAAEIGADAIINVRYMTTSVVGSAAELLAYGTAVKLSE